ncbi:MAG: 5'/3'-nucleotidase SurE [Pirellulaceae bacterium]|nr:5'/3'-nucleotidase SurE [Pirellulaceae bacterium]
MKLLLTNDDGIDAEGLAALESAMSPFGVVQIVAPKEPYSGCGHQITTHRPLTIEKIAGHRTAVDGSPADCARLGLLYLATDSTWLVSGINAGGNLGVDIHMSGTVAAAREAALLGFPAIAISQYRARESRFDWGCAAERAAMVFHRLRDLPLAAGTFWNVNLPDLKGDERTPELIFCDPDQNPLAIDYERTGDCFRYRGVYQDRRHLPDTDVDHCFRGHVTASRVSSGVAPCLASSSAARNSRREI